MRDLTISDNVGGGRDVTPRQSADVPASPVTLRILGKFDLVVGGRSVPVGVSCQRLLTLLAISGGRASRGHVAGTLWPDARATRASANLRSVLWRLQRCDCEVIEPSFHDLRLAADVAVDIEEVASVARCLLDRSVPMDDTGLQQALRCNLYEDVCPDLGDDEWLAVERERFRQVRVHSLEALSDDLIAAGWYGAAIEATLGVLRADPFRETAHYLLVKAHLAEGNQFEARRQYLAYCRLMWNELGLEPSEQFRLLFDKYGAQLPTRNPSTTGRDGSKTDYPLVESRPVSRPRMVAGGRVHRRLWPEELGS